MKEEFDLVPEESMNMSEMSSSLEQPEKNAVEVLKEQHQKVKGLFQQFSTISDSKQKKMLCEQIIMEVKIHAQIEEELVYPSLKKKEEEVAEEAYTEHELIKFMMKDIEKTRPRGAELDAKMKVLKELIEHHVEEEEHEALPELEKSDEVDLHEMGAKLLERTEQLKKRMMAKSTGGRRTSSTRSSSGRKASTATRRTSKTTSGRKAVSKTAAPASSGTKKTASKKGASTRKAAGKSSKSSSSGTRKSARTTSKRGSTSSTTASKRMKSSMRSGK